MTIKILQRPLKTKIQQSINILEIKTPSLTERCLNYIQVRERLLGASYRPNNDISELLRLEEDNKNNIIDKKIEILHASKIKKTRFSNLNCIYMYEQHKTQKNNNNNNINNYTNKNIIKHTKMGKRKLSQEETSLEQEDSDQDYQDINDSKATKNKRGKTSDLDQKKRDLQILEAELKTTKDEKRRKEMEQKILSVKTIIDAINVCTEYKAEKKKNKNTKKDETISTRSQNTESNKINGQQNNIPLLLKKQEEIILNMATRQSKKTQPPINATNTSTNNNENNNNPKILSKINSRSSFNNQQQINQASATNNEKQPSAIAQTASLIPKPIMPNRYVNLNTNQKKDMLNAILNSNTLKFTGRSLNNYSNGRNNNDLREKIQQIAGNIMVSFSCYSVESNVNDTATRSKPEYFLKIYTYDEEDYLIMDKKDYTSIGDNIKRVNNQIPLLLHTTLSKKINIDDDDFKDRIHNDHGIVNIQRISKNNETHYTTVKIECDNVQNWKELLTKGLQLETSKFNIISEWESEPLFCYNCLTYKHYKDNCPEIKQWCKICTNELLHENEKHDCNMKCKWCSSTSHKSNDKCCEKYKNEKQWKNRNYEKLKQLLEIQKSKYNTRREKTTARNKTQLSNDESNNNNLINLLRNELDTKLKSIENKNKDDKKSLESQIQEYKTEFEKFRESQTKMNKKIKDKIVSSNKIAQSGYIHIKFLVKEQMKNTSIRNEMEEELKKLEEEQEELSETESMEHNESTERPEEDGNISFQNSIGPLEL